VGNWLPRTIPSSNPSSSDWPSTYLLVSPVITGILGWIGWIIVDYLGLL